MDTRMGAPLPNQVFEDFVPKYELVTEADADILHIYLPEFKKEQLRVQATKSGILKISGQRPRGGDKWLRFHKEFPISANCNQNKITAKFERGILFVRQPKLIIAEKQLPAEPAEKQLPAQPQKPAADEPQRVGEEPSKKAEEQAKGEVTEPSQPQKPAANEQKMGEEPSKKAEEEGKRESTDSEPKKEKAGEAKKSDGVAEDETTNKTTSSKKDLTDTRNAAKIEGSGTNLATMLRQPRKILNVALVVLVVVGICLYVHNMIRSSNEAEE